MQGKELEDALQTGPARARGCGACHVDSTASDRFLEVILALVSRVIGSKIKAGVACQSAGLAGIEWNLNFNNSEFGFKFRSRRFRRGSTEFPFPLLKTAPVLLIIRARITSPAPA